MSERKLKYDIGQNVSIGGIIYKIIGTDDSTAHPSGQYKKWDYYIQAVDNLADRVHITEDQLEKLMKGNENDPAID